MIPALPAFLAYICLNCQIGVAFAHLTWPCLLLLLHWPCLPLVLNAKGCPYFCSSPCPCRSPLSLPCTIPTLTALPCPACPTVPRLSVQILKLQACCRRGVKGLTFSNALDKLDTYPALPDYGTPEYDKSPLGRLHASVLALLSSASMPEAEPVTEPTAEQVQPLPALSYDHKKWSNGISARTLQCTGARLHWHHACLA